jgi:CAAX prenyl protease-like protein
MTDPTPLDYQTPPKREPLVRDDIAYVLPMAIFLAFTWLGGQTTAAWPGSFAVIYLIKTLFTAAALVLLRRHFTRIRWNHWWLGILVGVVGIVQWIGMQLWLQHHFEFFRPSTGGFNPVETLPHEHVRYAFYAIRIAGAVLVVPFMEELFWRDFLWRQILAPNDFKLASVGEWAWSPLLIVSAAFATVHGNWWLTAIAWALMVGALLVYTRSLGACIIAHATTNLLLAVYVLVYHDWSFW